VTVLFTIDGSGAVVRRARLRDHAEQCRDGEVHAFQDPPLEVPRARRNGIVKVNFPWIFKPAGSE
jgi:hypothetical protein